MLLLQPSIRRSPVAHERADKAAIPSDAEFEAVPVARQVVAANEPCAKLTDHDWRWHAEASPEHPGRTRYVFRCKRCEIVGAHVDGA